MATLATESKDDHPVTNNMEVELNLSWFAKRDKPLISIKTKKDDTSSESSSSESEEEEIVSNPLEQWYAATQRRVMTLVTAGRSGAGKSTLISNMLKFKVKDDAKDGGHPQHQHSPSSITKEVEMYSSLREGGITVSMVDTPDLNASDVNDARAMAVLQEKTGGRCDMLLYCVSLLPDSKIDKEDKEVIRKLTLVFGQEVWRRAILVLTFTNAVKALYPKQSIKDIVEEYAKKFQSALHVTFKSDISVVSVFSCDRTQTQRDADMIIAIPVGCSPDEQFMKKLCQGWDETIFGEVLKKSNPDAVPVLFETKHPFHPRIIRMPLNVCKFMFGTILFAAIGGQPLALVTGFLGAKFGELIGWFTPQVGAGLGATIGYASGLGVAGVIVAIGIFIGLQETEREQSELDAVQKELEQYRKTVQRPPQCSKPT